MRVLLLDQFGEPGGAQHGLIEAAEGFAARGWETHAALPEGPIWSPLRQFCASVTHVPCGPYRSVSKTPVDVLRFVSDLRAQARTIKQLIHRHGGDVLYVNGPRLLPAAAWAHRKVPIVFHSHSVVTQASAARLAGEALRRSDAYVLTSSRFVARWLSHYVPEERLRVIYNGIRDLPYHPRTTYTRVGVLGRIAPEKGQLTFVHAAQIAARVDPRLSFTVCGGPVLSNATYFELVCREAGPLINLRPWTTDIANFFDDLDILVVPSESVDANPRVIPEAYASGVPVIAFDSGGVGELLEDGVTGILVKEHSAEALAQAMLKAVRAPELLGRLAEAAHRRWQQRYTLPRFQSEVCGALEFAAGSAPLRAVRASASP